jgi:hypothetical protein
MSDGATTSVVTGASALPASVRAGASAAMLVSAGTSAVATAASSVAMVNPVKGTTGARVAASQCPCSSHRWSLAHVTPSHAAASTSGTSSVRPSAKVTTARCATADVPAVHPLAEAQPRASIHTGVPRSSPGVTPT